MHTYVLELYCFIYTSERPSCIVVKRAGAEIRVDGVPVLKLWLPNYVDIGLVCKSSQAATTKYHRWVASITEIDFSEFWGLEGQDQGAHMALPPG